MESPVKLLFLSGSNRSGSFNAILAETAALIAEQSDQVSVTRINLADFEMPLYNGDDEVANGLPTNARRLKQMFREHHGFLIAAPEYNGSLTPLLVNTIAWLSRRENDQEPGLVAFKGKVAALVSTSPGGGGGLRGLVPLRMLLGNIGVHVIPSQLAVAGASSAFAPDGAKLAEEDKHKTLVAIVESLAQTADAIGCAESL